MPFAALPAPTAAVAALPETAEAVLPTSDALTVTEEPAAAVSSSSGMTSIPARTVSNSISFASFFVSAFNGASNSVRVPIFALNEGSCFCSRSLSVCIAESRISGKISGLKSDGKSAGTSAVSDTIAKRTVFLPPASRTVLIVSGNAVYDFSGSSPIVK